MGISKFTLREMQPSDSAALTKLITEFDGDMTTYFQVDPYEAITFGTEYRTFGVVMESTDFDGFVGMGTVRFGMVQFNNQILPFAFLDGLKVHKDFRGQGLGYQIANWRVQKAREMYGQECVVATGMLYDNYASHAVAAKWCRDFVEIAIQVVVQPIRMRPPELRAGITVRQLEIKEYEEFAIRQNSFYKNHNNYSPGNANSISNALGVSVAGKKPYRFHVAVDKNGNLLAGAQTWARGVLKHDQINNPPTSLRLMNKALHLLPSDFIIRDIAVNGLWYEPGQLSTARYLWESMRWECKDQGTTITAGFDPRDPVRKVATLRPWHQPRPQITVAIHGPAPINRNQFMFSIGRV